MLTNFILHVLQFLKPLKSGCTLTSSKIHFQLLHGVSCDLKIRGRIIFDISNLYEFEMFL